MNIKRGEIYYIDYTPAIGREHKGGRPAIIVGDPDTAAKCGQVLAVYLTVHPGEDIPEHVNIRSTGRLSTALCEKVVPISLGDIGTLCGVCTTAEMEQVDIALTRVLGLDDLLAAPCSDVPDADEAYAAEQHDELLDDYNALVEEYNYISNELLRSKEREKVYKEQNELLLQKLTPKGAAV